MQLLKSQGHGFPRSNNIEFIDLDAGIRKFLHNRPRSSGTVRSKRNLSLPTITHRIDKIGGALLYPCTIKEDAIEIRDDVFDVGKGLHKKDQMIRKITESAIRYTPAMSATARSTPNIALIKYWGNRNNGLRLPAADSVSMTLDTPSVEITVDHADTLSVRSFEPDGAEKMLKEKDVVRFGRHLELTREYLGMIGASTAVPSSMSITVRSHIPPAIGLASSAAVFSCLAKAYAGLIAGSVALTDAQISVIARLGSGSAARSIFGGYSALIAGKGDAIDSSQVIQIADENHWLLHDIVIVPSREEKKIGSTEGHELAWSSPLYKARLETMPRRNKECCDAILQKDFEKLQRVAEEDSLDMHRVMETSTPPLKYLSDATHRIIRDVEQLRTSDHLPVLYTMDAGPTVHLICPEEAVKTVREFAGRQKDCTIFEAKTGNGTILL